MDPLIGGVGSPQLPEMEYDHKFHNVLVLLHDVNKHEDDFHCDWRQAIILTFKVDQHGCSTGSNAVGGSNLYSLIRIVW